MQHHPARIVQLTRCGSAKVWLPKSGDVYVVCECMRGTVCVTWPDAWILCMYNHVKVISSVLSFRLVTGIMSDSQPHQSNSQRLRCLRSLNREESHSRLPSLRLRSSSSWPS